jgi:hypothetical protein
MFGHVKHIPLIVDPPEVITLKDTSRGRGPSSHTTSLLGSVDGTLFFASTFSSSPECDPSTNQALGFSCFIINKKYIIDCRDVVNANLLLVRLHRWNAIALSSCIHPSSTYGAFFYRVSPMVDRHRSSLAAGTFEYLISERTPPGFKEDADPETETMSLQIYDVFRMVKMTILLCILTPLSVRWWLSRPASMLEECSSIPGLLWSCNLSISSEGILTPTRREKDDDVNFKFKK